MTPPPLHADRNRKDHSIAEGAAYGWRRDYDEWPSWFNLVDRISEERRISRRAAQFRVVRALNCTTEEAYLRAIAGDDLLEILEEGELGTSKPLPRPIAEFRFFVTAEGSEARSLRVTVSPARRDRV